LLCAPLAQASDWRAAAAAAVTAAMRELGVPGMTVSLARTEDTSWTQGFGLADIENGVAATPETMYRLASVSKSITAIAALQLHEAGKLDLQAEIQTYCPQFPRKDVPITAWELLLHTSGIRHYNDSEEYNAVHYPDIVSTLGAGFESNRIL
jgi:CubicO group peptidase (beta-lactamase class C family)